MDNVWEFLSEVTIFLLSTFQIGSRVVSIKYMLNISNVNTDFHGTKSIFNFQFLIHCLWYNEYPYVNIAF